VVADAARFRMLYDPRLEAAEDAARSRMLHGRHPEAVGDAARSLMLHVLSGWRPKMSRRLPTQRFAAPWLRSTQVIPKRLPSETWTYALR